MAEDVKFIITAEGEILLNKILDTAWEKREGFLFHPEPLSVQVARAKSYDGGPVVMADHGDNTASGGDTVVEIETRDRHGLLYDIACTFRDQGLDIRAAKINTQGLRAIDSFYIQTAKRKKLTDSAVW